MTHIKQNTRWLVAVAIIAFATLAILFAPAAQAAEDAQAGDQTHVLVSFNPDQRIFNEDLLVDDGQVINENVAVLNGDVTIRAGGVINGDLSVVRGDVDVAGQVRGNLAVVQGNVSLLSSARVEGDVSIVSGEVEREQGAFVGGNFVGGPNGDWKGLLQDNNHGTEIENAPQFRGPDAQRSWLASLLWRLIQAVLWTLLITGLVVFIVWLAPNQVKQVAQTAETEPALSFAVGLIVSLLVTFLSMGLFLTICLAPAGFLLSSLLAIVALLGWAATAYWISEKLAALRPEGALPHISSLVLVALSALVLTGLTFFSWALIACIGFLIGVLLVSPGLGGVLVNLARRTGRMGPAPVAPAKAVPADVTTPETVAGAEVSDATSDNAFDIASGIVGDDAGNNQSESAATDFVTGEELGLTDAERAALQAGAGNVPAQPADFTRLKGVGPTFDKRLKDAGITTFAALAAMTPDQISAIIGWPPERILRDGLIEQAAGLAEEE